MYMSCKYSCLLSFTIFEYCFHTDTCCQQVYYKKFLNKLNLLQPKEKSLEKGLKMHTCVCTYIHMYMYVC